MSHSFVALNNATDGTTVAVAENKSGDSEWYGRPLRLLIIQAPTNDIETHVNGILERGEQYLIGCSYTETYRLTALVVQEDRTEFVTVRHGVVAIEDSPEHMLDISDLTTTIVTPMLMERQSNSLVGKLTNHIVLGLMSGVTPGDLFDRFTPAAPKSKNVFIRLWRAVFHD
ncbi:hypothetical protein pEaSNUABM54_00197 [Erwinia phage pEa_SNUABM_54]|nr:hypothetical protein pEaSNUABM54_00197 [Erwinia phage pEa_SNUABM_54]